MLQKHFKDNQWKQDVPDLNSELQGKGCEYLCTCNFSVFFFFYFLTKMSGKQFLRCHYGMLCV